MARLNMMYLAVVLTLIAGCAAAAPKAEAGNRKLLQNVVGQIVCDALGNCDDGRGHRYYDQNHDDRRRGGNDNRGDDRRDNNGRKLQQGIVGQIVCDALGNCDDGRGHRYYDQNHDDRRRGGDYNRGNDNRGDWNDGRRDNGRKLQQGIVGQIVCDALGNCDDGRGRRYYDENRDDRRRRDGDRRDWDNNRGYDGRRDNWGK
ncbi:hypothetical protein WJX75_000599 [Coccomyxa subellipsoidea]|uniref:Uncharacterized protein n=1 Tax=Coccomyxa subellipsoidea TaxID=248742 RepID=A0ABR2YFQ6_9CHLO